MRDAEREGGETGTLRRHHVGDAARLAAVFDQLDEIRTVGITQRMDAVHETIRRIPQPGQIDAHISRFRVGDFLSMDQPDALSRAAVRVGLIRFADAKVDERVNGRRSTLLYSGARRIHDEHIDLGERLRDRVIFDQPDAADPRRVDQHTSGREHDELPPRRGVAPALVTGSDITGG